MNNTLHAFLMGLGLFATVARAAEVIPVADGELIFLDRVRPLLNSRCVSCHGPDKVKAGLRLDSLEAALKGGDSGPALVPGKPGESILLASVMHSKDDLKMPPKEKLTAADIKLIETWIVAGAPWPAEKEGASPASKIATGEPVGDAWSDPRNPVVKAFGGQRLNLWSLKPVLRREPPQTAQAGWVQNDIDRFILNRLAPDNTVPKAMAGPRTLARRLYLDLHGLPPTPEQIRSFECETRNVGVGIATAQLTAELLASRRFGEHFARMWLDVVRYSDSNGFDWDDFRPEAWRFRDYVIRSFNADKPFDQFIQEQLAGDELVAGAPRDASQQDALIATGFLRLGPYDTSAAAFNEQDRARSELLADLTETTGSAFLGLTLSCCRCHDHKYDPITHADHFRMRAFFEPLKFADDMALDPAPDQKRIQEHNAKIDERIDRSQKSAASLLTEARLRISARDPKNKKISDDEAAAEFTPEEKAANEAQQKLRASLENERLSFIRGLCATDKVEDIPETHVLFQGDYKAKREAVPPGFFSVLDPNPAHIEAPPNPLSSGRRLALANWIASPENPLTARVFVNRIWLALMGSPLVATPNDFGLAGSSPEDAVLLDWLSSEFVREGWSVKKLIILIVGSATYRQASTPAGGSFTVRQPRRLGAEQLRDSMLAVSGLLTDRSGGPSVWPDLPPEVIEANPAFLDDNAQKTKGWYPSPKVDQYARSIFLVQKRNTRVPFLETFDLPENSSSCARRNVSTVAPQALSMLNGDFAVEAAQAFAARVRQEAGNDEEDAITHAFELAFQRPPTSRELAATLEFLNRRNLTEVCRVLLNLSEFAYVD